MHRIRLKKPWSRVRNQSESRVDVPDLDRPVSAQEGAASCYRRKFNCPTGLDSASAEVQLDLQSWSGASIHVKLNGTEILNQTAQEPIRLGITDLLHPHNELEIHLADGSSPGFLDGEVSILIIESSKPSATIATQFLAWIILGSWVSARIT